MGIAYVQAAQVAQILELPADAVLSAPASVGDTVISYGAPPSPAPGLPARIANPVPGALLAVGYLGTDMEQVPVVSATSSTVILADPLVNNHGAGELLLDVTRLDLPAHAASRMWDDVTLGEPEWFGYAYQVTEVLTLRTDRDGLLTFGVSKRPILEVEAFTYTVRGLSTVGTIAGGPWGPSSAKGVVFDTHAAPYRFEADPCTGNLPLAPFQTARCTATYTGGFAFPGVVVPAGAPPAPEMPGDIARSVKSLAARLWKEKDSGFSDTLGSSETGTLVYKKAVPADVAAMARSWKRAWWPT